MYSGTFASVTVTTTSFITLCCTHLFFPLFPACLFFIVVVNLTNSSTIVSFSFFIISMNCEVFVLIPVLLTFFSSILRLLLLLVALDAFGTCTTNSFPLEGAFHSCKFLWLRNVFYRGSVLATSILHFKSSYSTSQKGCITKGKKNRSMFLNVIIIVIIILLFQLHSTVGCSLAQLLMITTAQWMTMTVTTAAKRATGLHVTTTPLR